jgi:outer membrane protein TolC
MAARGLEAHSFRAARLPKVDLVAQYGLLAKFNNYEDYFNRFQRNNVQIGASIQVPLFANSSDEARAAQADIEARRLRALIGQVRGRIEAGIRQDSDRIADAEAAREVARLDLEVARDQVSILLAQMEEGRTSLRILEEARYQEEDRWQRLWDADYQLELARFELLRRTNSLVASLK